MKDEHETKKQLAQELLEMGQRIAELEPPDTRRKPAEQGIPQRRIWLLVAGVFVLLCILVWLNEMADLPRLLLGAPHTPPNWREAIIETALIATVGLLTVLGLIHDITERERAEEALRETEERLEAQYKGIPVPAYTWQRVGEDFVLVDYNDAAEAITQGKIADFIGKKAREMYQDMPEILEEFSRCVTEKTSIKREMPYRLKSTGESKHLAVSYAFVPPNLVMVHTEDITERKRVQEALQRYTERLRALAAQLDEVTEAERRQLARELHDQVGQNLTALGINLNIVRMQMPGEAAAPVRSRLDDSLSLVEQTTERVRDVMAHLRPPALDDYGLLAALHWYGEQFARRTDIAIAVEGEEPVPRLARRVENALFRIAQEALTNVAKHAQATHVRVTVEAEGGTLRLVVADDGIGFDPAHLSEPDEGRGWGLLTMTERAEAVGGSCRIESEPGQGAQVIVEVAR